MHQASTEFASPEQDKKLFKHEAGTLAVEYLIAVSKAMHLERMLQIARQSAPEVNEAFSGRLAPKLEGLLSRFPSRYRDRGELHRAMREIEIAWDSEDDEVFLSTLQAIRLGGEGTSTANVDLDPYSTGHSDPDDGLVN